MLKVVSFLWGEKYGPEHVNKLYRGVKRNLKIPFKFFVFTDRQEEFDKGIIQHPLWNKCRHLGGCYNRMYIFHEDFRHILGKRFVCIDLDCVVTGDLTPLFDRDDDFIINSYQPLAHGRGKSATDQIYNGGMFMMDAGARSHVWHRFDFVGSPPLLKNRRDIVGTDQAWIRHILGPNEKTWGVKDGVYEARNINNRLPKDARIVFFAGNRDPATSPYDWVKEKWI